MITFRLVLNRLVDFCHGLLLEFGIFAEIKTVRVALGLVFLHMLYQAIRRSSRQRALKQRPTLRDIILSSDDQLLLVGGAGGVGVSKPTTPTSERSARSGWGRSSSRSPSSSDAGSSSAAREGVRESTPRSWVQSLCQKGIKSARTVNLQLAAVRH